MELLFLIPVPIILFFGFLGYRDGVVKRLLEIAGLILTIVLTSRFAAQVNPWMVEKTGLGEGPALLATWAALFFLGFLASRVLAALVSKLLHLTVLGWLDKAGGVVVGLLIGVLVCSVALVALSQAPGGAAVREAYVDSPAGSFLYYAAPNFYRQARRLLGKDGDEVWDRVLEGARESAREAAGGGST